jgi:hypothetical protein
MECSRPLRSRRKDAKTRSRRPPFASTNELRPRSLSPSHIAEGRVPSPGACNEDRQFIAAIHPFRRGSVLCVSPFVVREPQISEPRIAQSPRIP